MIRLEFRKRRLYISLTPSCLPVSQKDRLGGGGLIFSSHLFKNFLRFDHGCKNDG